MPFENFYKDSFYDTIVRRWWIFSGLIFVIFIGFVLMPDPTEPTTEPIRYSESQQSIDEICNQIPKPEEFYFVEKKFPNKNFRPVLVTYFFKTKRSEQEILPSFIVWLSSNGWTDNKDKNKVLEFSKNDQTISISPVYYPEANYSIECTDWSSEL